MTAQQNPRGLTQREVEISRKKWGENRFRKKKKKSFFASFCESLGDPIIKILLIALGIHILLLFRRADWFETVGIAVSVFLATLISTLSEYGSEAAFTRLFSHLASPAARVRREKIEEIPANEIVVGDIVLLSAGEHIPADCLLLSGKLTVDESTLTGESAEREKRPAREGETLSLGAPGALFAGCLILSGAGEARVMRVGDDTYLGGISGEVQESGESPLAERLSVLARQISKIGYVAAALCALVFFAHHLFDGTNFALPLLRARLTDFPFLAGLLLDSFLLGLAVVVVAVPEGLPMMIAVVLSSGIRKMARGGVLVRKAAGIEAAGNMNILFTDKTGTLTSGKLGLSSLTTARGEYKDAAALSKSERELAAVLSLAVFSCGGAVAGEKDGVRAPLGGNATDRALLAAFLDLPEPRFSVAEKEEFDSIRKFAAAKLSNGAVFLIGAPEKLLPHCDAALSGGSNVPFARVAIAAESNEKMKEGKRVLCLCRAEEMPRGEILPRLTFLALAAFLDPLRKGARGAVETLAGAGVQVVMVTGDGKETAAEIARACGIYKKGKVALSGAELAALSDAELTALLPRLAVVARALPADKSRLVRLSRAAGLVVGMTGDGINDAPALRSADVGFAMGSGTEVAKEAGDVVILDDDLSSIARAVLYGRTVFKSIRKFITLQLVMNFSAVGISLIGPFIGFETPVTVVQMLWINLIMDTLGGLAFAGEAPMPYYMKEAPHRRDEPILSRGIAARIAVLSTFTVALSVFFLAFPAVRALYRTGEGEPYLLSAFFALFIFASVFNCFNARTDRAAFLSGIAKNPAFLFIISAVVAVQLIFIYLGGAVLRTVPLSPRELLFTFLFALSVLPVGFFHLVWRRLCGKGALY